MPTMMTVEQARAVGACRVCGLPIKSPPAVWWVGEGIQIRPDLVASFKDGTEFAHSACLGEDQPLDLECRQGPSP